MEEPVARFASLLRSAAAWWACFALLLSALSLPLLITDFPPLLDYPNHLARIFVLANPGDPVLSRMYAPHWTLIPNLATDIVGVGLLRVLPVYVAGRVLIALAVLLPVIGVIVYARATSGVRSYWPFASGLLGYNALLLLGFLNFEISLGLAFIAAALWHVGRAWALWVSTLTVAVLAVLIFFTHILGLVFLAMLMVSSEFALGRGSGRIQRLLAAASVFAVPAVLCIFSEIASETGAPVWDWRAKMILLAQPFMAYDAALDGATAVAVVAFLYVALVTRSASVSRPAVTALCMAIIGYVVMPKGIQAGTFLDNRFLLLTAFLLFACLVPKRPSPLTAAGAAVFFGAIFFTRLLMLTSAWHQHDDDVAQFRSAIAEVEPGNRVLVASADRDLGSAYWRDGLWRGRSYAGFDNAADTHLGGLLIIDRRAFFPALFARPSQQPLIILSPYTEISFAADDLPRYTLLENASAPSFRAYPYLENWKQHFDNVLVIGADEMPSPSMFLTQDLVPLHTSGAVALYQVKRAGT